MTADAFTLRLVVAIALALAMSGVVAAWVSNNMLKRLAGLSLAVVGALVFLAAIGAPSALLIAGAAVAFVQIAIGAALLVRVQESYGAVESPELDQADGQQDKESRA